MRQLLDFIARYESRGDYNIVWGGIARADHPPRPLVTMTVQEVLDWQDSIDRRYRSEAAGRYQIMEDTLRGLMRRGAVRPDALFDEATQDALAIELMRGRGLDGYRSGAITAETFANNLAKEWASMPVVTRIVRPDGKAIEPGASYYSGDGLNKAHAKVGDFLAAVRSVRDDPAAPVAAPLPTKPRLSLEVSAPVPNEIGAGGWSGFLRALARLFQTWRKK